MTARDDNGYFHNTAPYYRQGDIKEAAKHLATTVRRFREDKATAADVSEACHLWLAAQAPDPELVEVALAHRADNLATRDVWDCTCGACRVVRGAFDGFQSSVSTMSAEQYREHVAAAAAAGY